MASHEIVTLTINPALDKSATFSGLVPEKKIRCCEPQFDAGGGGVNVSRAIRKLGGNSLCLFTSGGPTGQILEMKVAEENLDALAIPVLGWTRESFVAVDTMTNAQYRFGFPGPELSASELDAVREALRRNPAKYLVASGSLCENLSRDFLVEVAAIARETGAKFILDTSGEALAHTLQATNVYLVKPNIGELAQLVGVGTLDVEEADDAARDLIRQGKAEIVAVSLGPQGAVVVSASETIFVPAPNVRKRSTVGAGDSMVGGMTWALSQGMSLPEVARWGVACGSAATMNEGTRLFHPDDAKRLYDWLCQRTV